MQPRQGHGPLQSPDVPRARRDITPDLTGPVGVLNDKYEVVSVVNVSVLLAEEQHKHPHDAIFLPNGDMVVPGPPGRLSYWKFLPAAED